MRTALAVLGTTMKLFGCFIVARLTAGRTVIKAVFTEANVDLALAEATVFFALAASFAHITLVAQVLGFRPHSENCSVGGLTSKVPLVTIQ
jgi:hypothetical protein